MKTALPKPFFTKRFKLIKDGIKDAKSIIPIKITRPKFKVNPSVFATPK